MSELALRIIVSLIAAPLAVWIVFAGGAPLAALLAIVSAVGAWEFFRIARASGSKPLDDVGIALAGILPLAIHAHYLGVFTIPPAMGALLVLLILGATIWMRGVSGAPLSAAATTLFGIVYPAGLLGFAYAIRYHNIVAGYDSVGGKAISVFGLSVGFAPGAALLILPLLCTWGTDVGAFFVGRAIGGRKLSPSISPGKTMSGAVGGVVVSMIVAYFYARYVLVHIAHLGFAPQGALLFGLLISIAAQTGDLFESLLKREGGVKDSSRIIPGHGGVLDRVDSLIFVMPVAYLLFSWLPVPVFG